MTYVQLDLWAKYNQCAIFEKKIKVTFDVLACSPASVVEQCHFPQITVRQ